jgi:hypothetical protein
MRHLPTRCTPCEIYAYEMHAYETPAYEMHIRERYTRDIYAHYSVTFLGINIRISDKFPGLETTARSNGRRRDHEQSDRTAKVSRDCLIPHLHVTLANFPFISRQGGQLVP